MNIDINSTKLDEYIPHQSFKGSVLNTKEYEYVDFMSLNVKVKIIKFYRVT